MVSMLAFVFKIIIFKIFCSQESKFSTVKGIFHNQGNFPQSRKFSTIKGIFHSEGNFPQ